MLKNKEVRLVAKRKQSYALEEILNHLGEVEKMARDGATELTGTGMLMGARMQSTAVISAMCVRSVVFICFPSFSYV